MREGRDAVVIPFPGVQIPEPVSTSQRRRPKGPVMSRPDMRRNGRKRKLLELPPGQPFVLAKGLTSPGEIPIAEAIAIVQADWRWQAGQGIVTTLSVDRYEGTLSLFGDYLTAAGLHRVRDITDGVCAAFAVAPIAGTSPSTAAKKGQPPGSDTSRLRISVMRAFGVTCRRLGLFDRDFAKELTVIRKGERHLRPLTPTEAVRLQDAADASQGTKMAASLAMALSGSGITEMAYTEVQDLDLAAATIRLYGRAGKHQGRLNTLDAWCASALTKRLEALRKRQGQLPPDHPLVLPAHASTYAPNHLAPQAARPLYTLFERASLTGTGIRPTSITEFAANRAFALTGDIEQVASLIGLSSLDSAKRLIDPDWQAQWGDSIGDWGQP
jgi:site-specific recombinase XerD